MVGRLVGTMRWGSCSDKRSRMGYAAGRRVGSTATADTVTIDMSAGPPETGDAMAIPGVTGVATGTPATATPVTTGCASAGCATLSATRGATPALFAVITENVTPPMDDEVSAARRRALDLRFTKLYAMNTRAKGASPNVHTLLCCVSSQEILLRPKRVPLSLTHGEGGGIRGGGDGEGGGGGLSEEVEDSDPPMACAAQASSIAQLEEDVEPHWPITRRDESYSLPVNSGSPVRLS
eukprot:6011447-Prymnesium_polylepis.1